MATQQIIEKEATVVPADEGKKMIVMGNDVTVKLSGSQTGGAYYVFEVITPPGVGVPPHIHQHEDEVIEVLEGNLEVQLGDQVYQAGEGALIHFIRYVPHGFRNTGQAPCRTRWTVIPGAGFETFFEELAALPADQPPDLEKVAAIFAKYDIELLPPPGL
ncbi:MAG: cupin domain-containing protein [Anaerolineae bacterium]|nr:cupin domain-containing protein [Anaerolineae bacterium]